MIGRGTNLRLRHLALVWMFAATSLTAATGLSIWQSWGSRADAGQLVLPDFEREQRDVTSIAVRMQVGGFTMNKQGDVWVIAESANHPVRAIAMDQLLSALATLRDNQKRTNDASQLANLSVANPEDFGAGTRIVLTKRDGAVVADVVMGQRGQTFYVRRSGENQVYRGTGQLPLLSSVASWMDVEFPAIDPETIASLEAVVAGQPYRVGRRDDGGFAPMSSNGPASGNANATAAILALSNFTPEAARPAQNSATLVPQASLVWTLNDGRTVEVEVVATDGDGGWVKTSSSAPPSGSGAVRDAVTAWNEKAEGRHWYLRAPLLASFLLSAEQVTRGPAPNEAQVTSTTVEDD